MTPTAKVLSALTLATLSSIGLNAQAGGYIGLAATSLDIENTLDDDLAPRGVRLKLGMPVAPMFDVEMHLGGGSDNDTTAADTLTATYFGAFLKGYVPLGARSALFGLAGVSAVNYTQEINGIDYSDERSGFSYGFGMETEISERLDLSADYVRYVKDDGPFSETSAVSLGLKLYF